MIIWILFKLLSMIQTIALNNKYIYIKYYRFINLYIIACNSTIYE